MSTANEVEADSHVLPRQFRPGRCGVGSFEMYAWNSYSSSTTIGSHLGMEEHDVELRLEATTPQDKTSGPPLTPYPAEMPHMFAAGGPMAAPAHHLLAKPTDAEVDLQSEGRVQLATLHHQNRRKKQGRQLGGQVAGRAARHTQMVAVAPPRLGAMRGDAFVMVECTPADVRPRVSTTCYEDVPGYQRHEDVKMSAASASCHGGMLA